MNIDVQVESEEISVDRQINPAVIQRAAAAVLEAFPDIERPALTVLITGDREIQALNDEYMGIAAPTDVLSFPSGELPGAVGDEVYLGDIMISLDTAARQSESGGHALDQEVELLTVHGVLHLLGFDHGDEAEKGRMWELQARVLKKLNNQLSPP